MATLTYQAGWVKNDIENYWYSLNLSKVLRFAVQPQCFYRNFCDAKNATQSGLHKGNIFHWNVYSNMTGDDSEEPATNDSENTFDVNVVPPLGVWIDLRNGVMFMVRARLIS